MKDKLFGQKLKYERKYHGWTQSKLSILICEYEYMVPSIYNWEANKSHPRPETLQKLCEIFGKPVEQWGSAGLPHTIWQVPYPANDYFIGREKILAQLSAFLAPKECFARLQRCILFGLGGIGKTQTALEFSHRMQQQYAAVLWVQADTQEILETQFANLAPILGLSATDTPRRIEEVKRWLQNSEQPWLLIFDNVGNIQHVLSMLPTRGGGAVLCTMRERIASKSFRVIEMEKMSQDESAHLLLERSGALQHGQEIASLPEEQRQQTEVLANYLDGLPLALDQAAAYIASHECGFATYLSLYQNQTERTALMRQRSSDIGEDHPLAMAATLELSLRDVTARSPIAAQILYFAACLHPDAIPEQVLLDQAMILLQAQTPATLVSQAHQELTLLRNYALLRPNKAEGASKTFAMHRLVQVILLDRLTAQERQPLAAQALLAVAAAFPEVDLQNWPLCDLLLPHALHVTQHVEGHEITRVEAGQLLTKIGIYLREHSRYHEAEHYFQQALALCERLCGPDDSEVAVILSRFAGLYQYQGKYEAAVAFCQRAIAIFARFPTHPKRDLPLHTLATLYITHSHYQEAIEFFEQALAIRKQQLGLLHPEVAGTLNNLACIYMYLGNYDAAETYFQQAQHIYEQVPENPLLAYVLFNLIELYLDKGRQEEAEKLGQRAQAISLRQFKPTDHGMAFYLNMRAKLDCQHKQFASAATLFQQALDILKQHVEPTNPEIASLLHSFANVRYEQGKFSEAEALFQRAIQLFEDAMGPGQPETANVRHDLARLRQAQGEYAVALEIFADALEVRTRVYGTHHFKTEETRKAYLALLPMVHS